MVKVIKGVAEGFGTEIHIDYKFYSDSVLHPETIEMRRKAIADELGSVAPDEYGTASGDFRFFSYTLGIKTGYISLGADATPNLHIYGMTFNHEAMTIGTNIHVGYDVKRLV